MPSPELMSIIQQVDLDMVLTVIAGFPVLAMAFSAAVRKIIGDRDGWKSVKSGETDNLHAAHINHDKSSPRYNDPSNGRMLTRAEHYDDHVNREGRNGLSRGQNLWALKALWGSMSEEERDGRNPP